MVQPSQTPQISAAKVLSSKKLDLSGPKTYIHVNEVRKMTIMKYEMAGPGTEPILAGAMNGRSAFAELVRAINDEPTIPTALLLDFKDVQVATASYLRESVFALKSYFRNKGSKYYPVAANANESVYDELLVVANAKNDAIIGCKLDSSDIAYDVILIGHLDPKQKLTFDLVHSVENADASQLVEQADESEPKNATAWNNRLASLAAKGIIREFTKGRAKYYRPVLEVGE